MFFDYMKEIENLIKMVSESELSEFTVKEGELELVIRKGSHSDHMAKIEQEIIKVPTPRQEGKVHEMPVPTCPPFMPYNMTLPAWGMAPEHAMPNIMHEIPTMEQNNEKSAVSESDGNKVKSPLVGTFYAAPSPEKEPFVKKGDIVKKGQVLGIVEAMKLMNEIECEYDGVVVDILAKNGDMVEYGQPLFIIK